MSILNFVKRILPRLDRDIVSEDMRTTEKELETIVKPAYFSATNRFKLAPPRAEEFKAFQAMFDRNRKYFKNAFKQINLVSEINARLPDFLENVRYIRSILDSVVDNDIIRDGMTMRAAFVVRAAANMSMMSRYMLSLLSYLYMREAMARSSTIEEAISLSPADIDYVEKNFENFVRLYAKYAIKASDFQKQVSDLPEAYVNKAVEAYLKSISSVSDPMEEVGLSGFIGTAIYTLRLPIANWQNARYEANRLKKEQLELKLLHLESLDKDKQDAITAREIGILQDRIDKLEAKLHETDEELGI